MVMVRDYQLIEYLGLNSQRNLRILLICYSKQKIEREIFLPQAEGVLSIQDCLALCAEELKCVSVTFQNTTSKCWLKNKEFGTPTQPMEGVKSANLRNPGKSNENLAQQCKSAYGTSWTFFSNCNIWRFIIKMYSVASFIFVSDTSCIQVNVEYREANIMMVRFQTHLFRRCQSPRI